MPDDGERGVADRGTGRASQQSVARRAAAAGAQEAVPAVPAGPVDRLVRNLIAYLDSGEKPSFKVLLAYAIEVRKLAALPAFARALANRPHAQWGTYLSCFFIVLQADGSRSIADIVAKWFGQAGAPVVHGERARTITLSGPAPGQSAAVAGGVSERLVYEGRTLVRLGGERFFISGLPGESYWLSRTTAVLFIYKADAPKKMYRLDFHKYMPKGAAAPVTGWHHNVDKAAKVLGLEGVNHTPAGGWGKAAGVACKIFKAAGRPLIFVAAVSDLYQVYEALDKGRAIARAGGRWAGAAAGAAGGAAGGARVGRFGGPYGAAAGTILGGLAGAFGGAALGEAVAEWGYCVLFDPLDSEEWRMLDASQVVAPPEPRLQPAAAAAP